MTTEHVPGYAGWRLLRTRWLQVVIYVLFALSLINPEDHPTVWQYFAGGLALAFLVLASILPARWFHVLMLVGSTSLATGVLFDSWIPDAFAAIIVFVALALTIDEVRSLLKTVRRPS